MQCPLIKAARDTSTTHVACPMAVSMGRGNISYYGGGQSGGTIKSETNLDKRRTVPCDTLGGIVRSLNKDVAPPVIHFWSLDCEGCEDVAIQTFNWQETVVAVLLIELNWHSCGGNIAKCEQMLSSHGMQHWGSIGISKENQIWYSPRYFRQKEHALPPSPKTHRSQARLLTAVTLRSRANHKFVSKLIDKHELVRKRIKALERQNVSMLFREIG